MSDKLQYTPAGIRVADLSLSGRILAGSVTTQEITVPVTSVTVTPLKEDTGFTSEFSNISFD